MRWSRADGERERERECERERERRFSRLLLVVGSCTVFRRVSSASSFSFERFHMIFLQHLWHRTTLTRADFD